MKRTPGFFWIALFMLFSWLAGYVRAAEPAPSGASRKAPVTVRAADPRSVQNPVSTQASTEDFKGASPRAEFQAGALTGLGLVNGTAGFVLVGHASRKILDRGFVSDINDQVWIEIELGPFFAKGSTSWIYSGHLRWDFIKDDRLTVYALGGLAGDVVNDKLGPHNFDLFPRFAAGVVYKLEAPIDLRAELSHELIVGGVSFSF